MRNGTCIEESARDSRDVNGVVVSDDDGGGDDGMSSLNFDGHWKGEVRAPQSESVILDKKAGVLCFMMRASVELGDGERGVNGDELDGDEKGNENGVGGNEHMNDNNEKREHKEIDENEFEDGNVKGRVRWKVKGMRCQLV